jgi:O-antigen/teichoic acid export membrane protein
LRRNQDLLRNAGSLAATTGVTSFLGFAYWIYAARVFPTQSVGYGSAAISTMTLIGTIGMFGIGTMLIGELPRGGNRGGLMMASFVASFVGSLILGVGFALISLAFGTHFVEVSGTFGRMAIFSFGVAITAATFVFDEATIGLMRGGLQLSRNVAVSIAKMAALPAIALVLHDLFGVGIMLAWVIGTVISLLPVAITIKRGGGRILHRPDWITFWRLGKVTMAHNWLNLAVTTPPKLIPVLVAIVVSPSSNGAYYIATMISSFLFMVPTHLSTVLFAIASATPEVIAEKLRFVLRMSLVIGIPAGLAMGLCAHFILSVFGSSYATLATGPLWISIVGYLPGLPSTVYIAVARVAGRLNQAAIFLTVFAVLRMAALVVGGKVGGLYGLSYGMLAVSVVQALITTPSVLRTAYGSVTVRAAADSATAGQPRLRSAELDEEMRLQQEAGLAAIISLATRVAPSPPLPDTDALGADSPTWSPPTSPQREVGRQGRHRRTTAVPVTRATPAITDTDWWPDIDEATFRSRQETGMAALIAIATHAARF